MDAEFKFFRKNTSSPLRFFPSVEFPSKSGFLGGSSKLVFRNLTDTDLTFTDDDGALKAGQTLVVPARREEQFEIDGSKVVPGNIYGFKVTPRSTTPQEQEQLLALAANPEIIIVG